MHVHTGYHDLYNYPQRDAVTHADWLGSAARGLALSVLGAELMVEIDDAVIGAAGHAKLIADRAADAALAAAWNQVPRVAGLSYDHETPIRAEYGRALRVDALELPWVLPQHPRDTSAHEAQFPSGKVRLPSLQTVLHRAGHFVFTLEGDRLPLIFTDAGVKCDGLESQRKTLSLGAQCFVYGGGAPTDSFDGAPLRLRVSARTHVLGEAHRVTGSSFTIAVDPQRGVVARG